MKTTFLILIFFLVFNTLKAQPFVPYDPVFMTYNVADLFVNYNNHVKQVLDTNDKIEGWPYVYDEFMSGVVYSKKEKAAFELDLNINAYNRQFEFFYEDIAFAMPNFAYDSVIINGTTFIPVYTVKDDKVDFSAMEVLDTDFKGNYLLKQYNIIFVEAKPPAPYKEPEPAKFVEKPSSYFLYNSDARLEYIGKLKDLPKLEWIPEDLGSYIKENKLKRKNESDLIKIFRYLYASN